MLITATEFKQNMGEYLSLVREQDIYITKNGRLVAKLTDPALDRVALLDSLVGIAGNGDVTLGDIRKERLGTQ